MAANSFGTVTILVLVLLIFLSYSAKSSTRDTFADDRNKIFLTLVNSSFAPLTRRIDQELSSLHQNDLNRGPCFGMI